MDTYCYEPSKQLFRREIQRKNDKNLEKILFVILDYRGEACCVRIPKSGSDALTNNGLVSLKITCPYPSNFVV